MSLSSKEIAQLVSQLEHPDAEHQREIMDELIALGTSIVPQLTASLSLVEPSAREALVRVLSELGDTRAMVPLMRLVYDRRDRIEDANARGLAMKALMQLAQPSHAPKMFDFLMDVRRDADPFVRGWALEAMGRFGDARVRPILGEALKDEHDFVRERAHAALESLEGGEQHGLEQSELSRDEILQKIRNAQDGERVFWMNALHEREDTFELAVKLVKEGGKGAVIGLQVLLGLDDERARDVARRAFDRVDTSANKAICLRILAKSLHSDASPEELAIIRAGHAHSDTFVRMAAMAAGGVSGEDELVRRAMDALQSRDLHVAISAAEALSHGLTPEMKRFLPQLRDALARAHKMRHDLNDEEPALLEAHMLRAITNVLPGLVVGRSDVQRDALRSLREASAHWPVLVSALRLLRDTTDGVPALAKEERWQASHTLPLIELLTSEDDRVRERVIALLKHGAPSGIGALADQLERIIHDDSLDLTQDIIPLLERSGSQRAKQLLQDLCASPDEAVQLAAQAALRNLRNAQPVIDARFSRPPDA